MFFVRAEVDSSPVHDQMFLFINIHVENIIYLTESLFVPWNIFFYSTPTFPHTFILKFNWADIRDQSGPLCLDRLSELLALIQHNCCFQVLSEILQVLRWRQVNSRSDVIWWLRQKRLLNWKKLWTGLE